VYLPVKALFVDFAGILHDTNLNLARVKPITHSENAGFLFGTLKSLVDSTECSKNISVYFAEFALLHLWRIGLLFLPIFRQTGGFL
jgi:hypothetical protein